MMIPRESYGRWLDEFREKKVVKVLTGLRRSGKSTILELYMQKLRSQGVSANMIVSLKYLLTMDDVFVPDHNGVRTLNVIDYLLGRCELD